jgi:hypothetical protein
MFSVSFKDCLLFFFSFLVLVSMVLPSIVYEVVKPQFSPYPLLLTPVPLPWQIADVWG